MLCAPLVTRDSLVGVLKIAARHPEQLKPFDAELVEHFRSQAAIAIQNLHRTESLRARVVTAERKHAMADLARSVSHDVNNALGSMLPLIQQMQAELHPACSTPRVRRGPRARPEVAPGLPPHLRRDADLLANAARRSGYGHVRRAIDTAFAILKYGMSRSAIELQVNVPDDVPEVACSQSDLEQVFLNLLTNAREATPHGGRIMVTVRSAPARRDLDCRHRMRHPGGEPAAGARAVLHHEAARQRPRPVDLPLGPVGGRGHANDSQRARRRHRRARPRSRAVAQAHPQWHEVGPHPRRRRRAGDAPGGRAGPERRHRVAATRLSREALAVADEFHPELAIVDIRMPDLDGFELMAQLKARFPALDVILMTGSVDDLDEKLVRAIRSRAFYFIQKPFDREVLRTLVERCVELRRRREEHRQNLKRRRRVRRGPRVPAKPAARARAGAAGCGVGCRYTPVFGARRRPLRLRRRARRGAPRC